MKTNKIKLHSIENQNCIYEGSRSKKIKKNYFAEIDFKVIKKQINSKKIKYSIEKNISLINKRPFKEKFLVDIYLFKKTITSSSSLQLTDIKDIFKKDHNISLFDNKIEIPSKTIKEEIKYYEYFKASNDRIISAHHRATKRINMILYNNVKEIFEISLNYMTKNGMREYVNNKKLANKALPISYGMYGLDQTKFFYFAKLKTNSENMLLKDIFKILQTYGQSEKYDWNGKHPLIVELQIGSNDMLFLLSLDKNNNQIITSGYNYRTEQFEGNSYRNMIEQDNCTSHNPKTLANKILESLYSPINKQPDFEFSDAMVQLIVTTQVSEACPHRTPGMDKLARSCFKYIAAGKATFQDVFDIENTSNEKKLFIPVGRGGTQKARDYVGQDIVRFNKSDISYSHDMSDSSDDEN